MDHNINYVFETMKRVVPIMVDQVGGAVVNLASIAAMRFFGVQNYGVARKCRKGYPVRRSSAPASR